MVASTLRPVSVTSKRLPPTRSAYVTDLPAPDFAAIRASRTVSSATGVCKRSDPSSSSTRRASAATRRIGQPSRSIASEPPEPPWSGVVSVRPITSRVWSNAMSSSSHIICRNAVPVPCPPSVLPTKNVAVLSGWITIQVSSCKKSGSG